MALTLKVPANKNDHYIGSLDLPVILVEYCDFENPACAPGQSITDNLLDEFKGQLCFVLRHYPQTDIHPTSAIAALAAEAAGEQGQFWKMSRQILKLQPALSAPFLIELAIQMGLDSVKFITDLENDYILNKIDKDMKSGDASGVETTPGFYLNGILMENPISYEILKREIEEIIHENEISP